jgi:anti-anti-sigma factor
LPASSNVKPQSLFKGVLGGGSVIYIDQKTYTTQDGNTVIVLTPAGRLDISTAWQFRLKLQECISKLSRHVVVNLGQVNFIDSSGLTSLVAGMRDADKVKGSFRICNVHPEAKLVFEVTMMDTVFEIFEIEQEALEGGSRSIAS